MYSRLLGTVNGWLVLALALPAGAGRVVAARAGAPFQSFSVATASCDPRFATLFTPAHPQLGRYEVCTSTRPLDALVRNGWPIEPTAPTDAFGAAGAYDRAALARLYGGRRPLVARGWIQGNGTFESVTLVSPYPDPSLTHLEPGTLIIRFIICCT
jgi:hypothetical protein